MAAGRTEARITYHNLDALRGVAAIMVVLFHASYWTGFSIAPGGYLAVDVFFALSGFVIAHSYDARLASGLSTARFALIRLVRFWPLYALGLVLGLGYELLLVATHNHYAEPPGTVLLTAILGIFFLPTLFHTRFESIFPLNVVSWSLFYELVVNILYSLCFRALTGRVLVGVAALSGALLCWFIIRTGSVWLGFDRFSLFSGLIRTSFSFSLGVLIYRYGPRSVRVPLPILCLVLILLLAAPVPAGWRMVFDLVAVLAVSPFLVLAGASSQPSPAMSGLATTLGALSYPIYVVHRPLLYVADTITRRLHLPTIPMLLAFMLALLVFSLFLDRRIDRPVRRWMLGRLGLGQAPQPREVSLP